MSQPDHGGVQDPPVTLAQALLRIGPGLILAGAIVGTGELIATTNLGARAGFALLWLVILSCFIKVFVQIELGRYAISSGEATFSGFRRLPGPGLVLVWWCLLMILATQMQIGAMIGGVAQAIELATPGFSERLAESSAAGLPALADFLRTRNDLPWAVVVTLSTIALLASGSYRLVERGSALLVVTFTLMTILCVGLLPGAQAIRLDQLAQGLSFQVPEGAIVAALTMFGITGVGATELLAYPYWCIEKGYAAFAGPRAPDDAWALRARGWLRVMRLDAWVSMGIYTISTLAFYLLGAAVLHGPTGGAGLPADDLLPALARMYEPSLGPDLALGFLVVGAFAVLYSTLFAATAGNSRLIADFLRVNGYIGQDEASYRRWVRVFCVLLPLAGFVLYLTYRNPVLMVTVGGVMQAVSLPFIAGAAVFLRYRRTDRRITPGLLWDLFLWASMLGLTLAAAYSLWKSLAPLWERLAA